MRKLGIAALLLAFGAFCLWYALHIPTPPVAPPPAPPRAAPPAPPSPTNAPDAVVVPSTLRADIDRNLIRPIRIEIRPTCSAAGIDVSYTGDANGNATGTVFWRRHGEANWRTGLAMSLDRSRQRMLSSIWPLSPGERIDVRVQVADPDPVGQPLTGAATSRAMVLTNAVGRVFHVSALTGSDSNPGTAAAPFKTLQRGANALHAGDTLLAASGVYRETVRLGPECAGEPDKPIVIMAAPGASPVLDGSTEVPRGSPLWKRVGRGMFVASADFGEPGVDYVAADGTRLYPYLSSSDLARDAYNAGRAFWYDDAGKRLLIRLEWDESALSHVFNYATRSCGFSLEGARNVVIRGFELRYFGKAGIRVSGRSTANIVLGNTVHNVPIGIAVTTGASGTAVWSNDVAEAGLPAPAWGMERRSDCVRQGIVASGAGPDTSICHNRISGFSDAIVLEPAGRDDLSVELNSNADIMFNTILNNGDAALRLSGGGINVRCHGNAIRNTGVAFKIGPIAHGPVYVSRNTATYVGVMFDLSADTPSPGWIYCFNNSGYPLVRGPSSRMICFSDYGIPEERRVFKNNLSIGGEWAVRNGRTGAHTLDYNCYFNTPDTGARRFEWDGKSFLEFDVFRKESGQEAHGMYADPRFLSAVALAAYPTNRLPLYRDVQRGDFILRADSPAIDAGVAIPGVTDGFTGAAPDIGAVESEPGVAAAVSPVPRALRGGIRGPESRN